MSPDTPRAAAPRAASADDVPVPAAAPSAGGPAAPPVESAAAGAPAPAGPAGGRGITYADAGVDTAAGDRAVEMASRKTS